MTREEAINKLNWALEMAIEELEQEPCDKCEVGNPCLYCKHEFESQESEGLSGLEKPNNRMKYRVFTERDGETAYLIQFYGRWWIVFKHKNYDSPVIGLWFDTLEEGTDYMLMNGGEIQGEINVETIHDL